MALPPLSTTEEVMARALESTPTPDYWTKDGALVPPDILTIGMMEGLLAPLRESMGRTEKLLENIVRDSSKLKPATFPWVASGNDLKNLQQISSDPDGETELLPPSSSPKEGPIGQPDLPHLSSSQKETADSTELNKVCGMTLVEDDSGVTQWRGTDSGSRSAHFFKVLSAHTANRQLKSLSLWLAGKLENADEPTRSGCLHGVTSSGAFERTTAIIIVLNAFFVSITTDWEISNLGKDLPIEMFVVEVCFLVYYSIELSLRLAVHRLYFFINCDWKLNVFDLVLVVLSVQDVIISNMTHALDSGGNIVFIRVLRLVRMAKILRAVRAFRVFRNLVDLMESIRHSMVTLFWTFIMLIAGLYLFALVFVQGMAGFLASDKAGNLDEAVLEESLANFGSVWLAMLSLYMAVTGGNDWAVYYDMLSRCGDHYGYIFIFFTFYFVFAIFNVLTGQIVQNAIIANQGDVNDKILDERQKMGTELQDFRDLCKRIDTDNSGWITFNEFVKCMEDEQMVMYMASVGLEVRDVDLFFKIVANAPGADHRVDIDKFVEGCMSMRGYASGVDMQKTLYEIAQLYDRLEAMENNVTEQMSRHGDLVGNMLRCLQQTQTYIASDEQCIPKVKIDAV